jgi:hypothetical protein
MAGTGAGMVLPPMKLMARDTPNADPLSGDRLYDHVVHYTQIGEHRTGTTGDRLTAEWIRREFSSYGLKAAFHPVTMNLFEVTAGFLEVGEARFRADPEWYPTPTPIDGIRAPMRMLKDGEDLSVLRGKIWVVEVQMLRPVVPREIKEKAVKAAEAGALAVVMTLTYRTRELTGRGAHGENGQKPWCPIPLVGVAGKHDAVVEAAKRGETARLVVQGREEKNAQALNVTGTVGSGKNHIIVTTPQSGMFRCGGERGGGIAVLLGLAEWVGRRDPNARYLFSANTGHEQDGSGARLLVETLAPPPEEVSAWLHLGAGVSTWQWRAREDGTFEKFVSRSGIRNFGAVPELAPLLKEAFEPIPDLEPQSERFAGELRAYVRVGYPGFGFWGYNDFGHTVADGPEHCAPELLEPVARCLARALEMIEQRG